MKSANHNEMDVLLQSLARRDAALVSGVADKHLDADELNAFAEGAITERARARYSAHLAECSNCRGIVVTLTQSAGLAAAHVAPEKSPTFFWQQVGAFFSQPIFRFVLPAVVLVSIIGIGLIVLRQDQPHEFVAKHEPAQTPNSDPPNPSVASSESQPAAERTGPPSTVPPITVGTPSTRRRDEAAGTVAGSGTSEGPAVLRKESDSQLSEASPTFAPDIAAKAPPPPAPAYAARDQASTVSRQEASKSEMEGRKLAEEPTPASNSVDRYKAASPAAKAGDDQRRKRSDVHGLMRAGTDEDKDKNDATERPETMTVSGKRFVRQDNSWVDERYQQASATTNVKRGSEQYRALIADEPGLRIFAERMTGQVIVVWKGRAYKFY